MKATVGSILLLTGAIMGTKAELTQPESFVDDRLAAISGGCVSCGTEDACGPAGTTCAPNGDNGNYKQVVMTGAAKATCPDAEAGGDKCDITGTHTCKETSYCAGKGLLGCLACGSPSIETVPKNCQVEGTCPPP